MTVEEAPGRGDSDQEAQPLEIWRRGWGSNPRSRCQDSSFRDCPIRPLSHLSAWSNSPQVRVGMRRMCRCCDWLWGELTLGSVIFQSVFFSLEEPVRIIRARLAGLARKAGRVKRYWEC